LGGGRVLRSPLFHNVKCNLQPSRLLLNIVIMRRLHNTNQKYIHRFLKKRFSDPNIKGQSYSMIEKLKPSGIWYAIDNDWIDWCSSEIPHWIGRYQQVLQIDHSRILVLKSIDDIKTFISKYKVEPHPLLKFMWYINWKAVASEYAGIEIHNYREIKWGEGYDFNRYQDLGLWFSAWDVSSGCIWDLSAIRSYHWAVTPRRYRTMRQKPKVAKLKMKQWMKRWKQRTE
jgi:hypothetical protein